MVRTTTTLGMVILWASAGGTAVRGETPAPRTVEFNRDVRPILADKCFACHGPDKGKRKADLRLDVEKEARADRGGYHALVAGKPADSKLYQRIVAANVKERMPPARFGKPLSAREIEILRLWIEQGVRWQEHWSRITPQRAALPRTSDPAWARNAIDHFVLARLDDEKLRPSPDADRRTLIRRLSFDLTGLPPAAEDVEAFVADASPTAHAKLVDRILSSKHYGERMAIYWLDLVRYADTAGYHSDNHRDVTPYRDYVIKAFNANKPFDRFTIEQLAGDLLPEATTEQRIASGYNRLLQTTEEGGAQAKEYLAKYSADRVRNTSVIWLSATMGCAECHDHKFDPFTTREFYSLAAFFADLKETAVGRQEQTAVPDAEYQAEIKRLDDAIAQAKKQLITMTPPQPSAQVAWEKDMHARLGSESPAWVPVKPEKLVSEGGATLSLLEDLSVLSSKKNPAKDVYVATLHTDLKKITGIRLEALQHPSLPGNGLSRGNGNFVLTAFEVEAQAPGAAKPEKVRLASAVADYSQEGFLVASLAGDKPGPGWAVEGHVKKQNRQAVFTFADPIAGGAGTVVTVRLKQQSSFPQHNVGCFRLSLTTASKPGVNQTTLPAAVLNALRTEPSKRTPAEREALTAHYRNQAPEFAQQRGMIAALEKQRQDKLKAVPTSLVSTAVMPRPIRILPRGNWLDDSGEIVTPNVPGSLPPLKAKGRATRLDLARWMVAPENPLTARVFVNRLWKLAFGQGIVRTLDDFGSQGAWPTHPDLLDWLAVEFRDSGWDVKHLLKLMVTSRTYQQSSRADERLRHVDPYNYLLARQGRFRLDAEMVRDNALAVSGLLSRKVGGRSVKPYQPDGYWDFLNFPRRTYQKDVGDDQYRRGLYTYWQRTFPHPSLVAFDAPSREECTVERPRSNTPLQALVLLNDPTYVEAARVFAEHVVREGGAEPAGRIQFAYRRALGRPAAAEEVKLLESLYEHHRKQYQASKAEAEALLKVGDRPVTAAVDPVELAAWTSVARVVLNLHEAITRN